MPLIICPDSDAVNEISQKIMTIQRIRSGLFLFGDGCIRVDSMRTNNQERIINNP